MHQNAAGSNFKWTKQRLRAAQLLAEDSLTGEEIAQELGVNRATLHRWSVRPEFAARIAEINEATAAALIKKGVRVKANRLEKLNTAVEKIEALIAARASDMKTVPGGETGLLVRRKKIIGSGENAQSIDEYQADMAVIKEYRELLKQAAIELGEWTERQSIEGNIQGAIEASIIRIPAKVNSKEEWERLHGQQQPNSAKT